MRVYLTYLGRNVMRKWNSSIVLMGTTKFASKNIKCDTNITMEMNRWNFFPELVVQQICAQTNTAKSLEYDATLTVVTRIYAIEQAQNYQLKQCWLRDWCSRL